MMMNQPRQPRPQAAPRPRRLPRVIDYVNGRHWPSPVLVDGTWRCTDCRRRLRWYQVLDTGEWRLRHYRP